MSRRRRIFVERMTLEALTSNDTSARLRAHRLEPIVALPPSRELPEWAEGLRRLGDAVGGIGLWPLLEDGDGYWISPRNLDRATARVASAVEFARRAGVAVRTLCLDIEPSLDVMRDLAVGRWTAVGALARGAVPPDAHAEARRTLARLLAVEAETYVVLPPVPFVAHGVDRRLGILRGAGHVEALMTYSSLARPWLRSRRLTGLWLSATAWAHARRRWPAPALALGCTGPGKLGDERAFAHVDELRRDVIRAQRAGIDDLALFSLEGVLDRPDPDAWLEAFGGRTTRLG